MKHVMIDLETLSLQPNAAIIEIAAKEFNPVKEIEVPNNTFHEFVDSTSCAMHGMDFDKATIEWWSQQELPLKKHFDTFISDYPIGYALNELTDYLHATAPDGDMMLWSQGADFDIAILRSAYRNVLGKELPVKYRNVRDARTYFLELVKVLQPEAKNPYELVKIEGSKHTAEGDVDWSIKAVQYATDLLNSTFVKEVDHDE